jgi:drug/metabolite transporter (DMT)-like permease
MTQLRRQADWLVFIALGVMWGSSYLFIKIGVEALTPITLVALRLGVGALFLGVVVLLARERLPRGGITYVHLTVMAVLNIVIPFTLITWAELSVPSSLAAILTAAAPLFTIVIAAIALRSEPITAQRVIGLLVGFVGVAVLTGPAALASAGSAAAMAALLAAAASYAAAAVYARRTLTGLRPMVPALLQVTIAFAISGALALLLERPLALDVTPPTVVAVLWLGVLGSGVAYLAYFRLIGSWGATRTAAVAYLLPVVGIALGVLVANETVDLRIVAGTALVIGGVALVNARVSRQGLASIPGRTRSWRRARSAARDRSRSPA